MGLNISQHAVPTLTPCKQQAGSQESLRSRDST